MPPVPENTRAKMRIKAGGLSLAAGLGILGLKFMAYRLTGSSAVLSDALESIINVVAGAFVLLSVWLSAKPPDRSHPYGHGKIEYFSAGFEGALIILAAAGIFRTGLAHLLKPRPLPNLDTGMLLLLAAAVANLVLGLLLVRVGRRTASPALEADGRHVLTDVYTSAGAIASLAVVKLSGKLWVDGAMACLLGVYVLVAGSRLVFRAYCGLMDASNPELLASISAVLRKCRRQNWIDIHQLRAWQAGDNVNIDLHLVLPRDLTLSQAHSEAEKVETMLKDKFGRQTTVLVHTDPCPDPSCTLCNLHKWNRETLTMASGDKKRLAQRQSSCGKKAETHKRNKEEEGDGNHFFQDNQR